jgi:hypothetical protein
MNPEPIKDGVTMHNSAPRGSGNTVDEVVDYYFRFLARNQDLTAHFEQFKKRLNADPKAAQAEAVVFSFLRAEDLQPGPFEDVSAGGPDYLCSSASAKFLVEVTSLDSEVVSEESGLPAEITGPGGGAFGLITNKLQAKVKAKASQLGGQSFPGILAIASDHAFAGMLLDRLAAEYLMTSAPQINVPVGGGPTYTTTDLKHSAFYHATGVLDASGVPIIKPFRQSVSAILLIATYPREIQVVGLLHPEAVRPLDPALLPKVPFLKSKRPFSADRIATEWVQADDGRVAASFPHRHIR